MGCTLVRGTWTRLTTGYPRTIREALSSFLSSMLRGPGFTPSGGTACACGAWQPSLQSSLRSVRSLWTWAERKVGRQAPQTWNSVSTQMDRHPGNLGW